MLNITYPAAGYKRESFTASILKLSKVNRSSIAWNSVRLVLLKQLRLAEIRKKMAVILFYKRKSMSLPPGDFLTIFLQSS